MTYEAYLSTISENMRARIILFIGILLERTELGFQPYIFDVIRIPVTFLENSLLDRVAVEKFITNLNRELRIDIEFLNIRAESYLLRFNQQPKMFLQSSSPDLSYLRRSFGASSPEDLNNFFFFRISERSRLALTEIYDQSKIKPPQANPFISNDGMLHFQDIIIKLSELQCVFLSVFFKDPTKEWSYDEIWDEIYEPYDEPYEPKNGRRFYNCALDINKKIALKTSKPDFLKFSMKAAHINKCYLVN